MTKYNDYKSACDSVLLSIGDNRIGEPVPHGISEEETLEWIKKMRHDNKCERKLLVNKIASLFGIPKRLLGDNNNE